MRRRDFLALCGTAPFAAASSPPAPVKFGVDLFSLRSQGWTPLQLLDYCAKFGVQVVHFSEIRFIGSLEEENLKRVRARAREHGIEVELGMRSICPTSKMFDPALGSAEDQLARMIPPALAVGSKIIRCVLGSREDRSGPLPIEAHIENTVRVLRAVRSRITDAGLKVAVENHAGDMQARELKSLIEAAGKDFVGACLDSGNPLWAIEDPHLALETLAPYVLTSHVRDSAVWNTPMGAAVAWTRMGDGNIDIAGYVRRYAELCPGRALSLEIIVMGPLYFNYRNPQFWDAYRNTPAWEFARFLALVERGTPRDMPRQPVSREAAATREREDLEASIAWTRKLIGLS
jgi:sugar phosphate isomerase/epimerase